MQLFLYKKRQEIIKSLKWLLGNCGYNWRSLKIDTNMIPSFVNNGVVIKMVGMSAPEWEKLLELPIVINNKHRRNIGDNRLILLEIPDDTALLFKLKWG